MNPPVGAGLPAIPSRRVPRCAALAALFLGVGLVAAPQAHAEPAFARMYKQVYGYSPSCNACHKDGGGTPLNNYGEQYKTAGMDLAAFDTIAELDGDGDGHANGAESAAKANPGHAKSTPGDTGNWLDTASLIPQEVQRLFPEVRTWLPKDAILTAAEIERAAAFGVTLGADDENTIYIPVENRRPAGTALIFPARFDGRDFFLMLATDRKLNVTTVQPLNTRLVPEARDSKVYASFEGQAVNRLPAAEGDGVDAAITEAVRKAGALLWVRLKGA